MRTYVRIAVLIASLALVAAGCRNAGSGGSAGSGVAPTIRYGSSSYGFVQNVVITPVVPTIEGGDPTDCTASPALPTGLSIDDVTCVISGTPIGLRAATNYTIRASNPYGSSDATIAIEIVDASELPSVSIENLHDRGVVETGFLMGTASDNVSVARVEVSLDGGGWQAAVGTTEWSFALPTGANTWRDGSEHTIAVRGVDGDGYHSFVPSITVRKGTNRDVNGDGYGDLAVGADGYNANAGRVYVFHGGGDGIADGGAGGADTTISGGTADDAFGYSVSLGDVNGDGYGDLTVGATGYDSEAGRVYLFHGRNGGIAADDADADADTTIDGDGTNRFGSSVSVGDINGDGFGDLVAGRPGTTGSWVYTFHGDSDGISASGVGAADSTISGSMYFGVSTAVGDVNGDGFGDLVVGAVSFTSSTGRAYVFLGGGNGIAADDADADADTTIDGEETNSQFGSSMSIDDVDGDGYGDLAVAARLTNRVYVFHGGLGGVGATNAGTDADATVSGGITISGFGNATRLGDVDGDGYADLVVGANDYAFIFHSSGGGIATATTDAASTTVSGETGSDFGYSASLGDLNGDGYRDLVVGAAGYNADAGRVSVFHGRSGGVADCADADADTTITGEGAGDSFGTWVD